MKKVFCTIALLLTVILFTVTACSRDNKDSSAEGDNGAFSYNGSVVGVVHDFMYRAEYFSLLPSSLNTSLGFGDARLINDTIYIPRIAEELKQNGDTQDDIRHLYFELLSVSLEDGSIESIVQYFFEPELRFVRIIAVDIISLNEPGGILLLADLFTETEEQSTVLFMLTKNEFNFDEVVIEQSLIGVESTLTYKAWFDSDRNIYLLNVDLQRQKWELIILDPTAKERLAQLDATYDLKLAIGDDGSIWGIDLVEANTSGTILHKLDKMTWTWATVKTDIPIDTSDTAVGFYATPEDFAFTWLFFTEQGLFGITNENDTIRIVTWHDIDVRITRDTSAVFNGDGEVILLTPKPHPQKEGALMLESILLSPTDEIEERETLIIGGVNINTPSLHAHIRRFNSESKTHRAVIVDYAQDEGWEIGVTRLRVDLMTGKGPDIIIFEQWGDYNDITYALIQSGYLADMNVYLENDPVLAREDFFENILDIWTSETGELSLITGAVVAVPFWGPSEKLDGFTDFTHEGFLTFLRNAKAQGVKYPAGLNFLPYTVLQSMLFADNTFFCYKTAEAKFDNELFKDILNFANSIPDEQQTLWINEFTTGEASNPIPYFRRGEQLMTNIEGIMDVFFFRIFDAAVNGLTPIGAPNSAGVLSIPAMPIWRMGIRANSPNIEAGWEFIRIYLQQPNVDGIIEGLPILRSLLEEDINRALLAESFIGGHYFNYNDMEVPVFTEERAAVLRLIMENITHEYHPDPYIKAIIWEDVAPFFAGIYTAEEAAKVIQNRVATYLAESR